MRWDSKGRKENSPGDCFQPVAMIDGQAGGDDPKTKSASTDSRSGISGSTGLQRLRQAEKISAIFLKVCGQGSFYLVSYFQTII